MPDVTARYEPRIREIRPDLTLDSLTYNGEGLVNDVIVVNGEWIFRFAKSDEGIAVLRREVQILDLVRPHVNVKVPDPFHISQDVIAYPRLRGETLSRNLLFRLSEPDRRAVAGQLAEFLRALHGIAPDPALPHASAPVKYEDWVRIRKRVEEKVYPLLMAHQIEWARQLFDGALSDPRSFDYQPRLVHGDLGPYHILFDRGASRISGIIDFGVSGLGDPAVDFGNLLQVYGESFVNRLHGNYPELEPFMRRARFYAQAIELQWALSGVTSHDTLWFLAHLGGARDIRPDPEGGPSTISSP